MTEEQRKQHFDRVCAECEECYYYFNCDTEEECFGQEEPCFEWLPSKLKNSKERIVCYL